ncbi:palindromic element RPE1 domain-containing protein [Candidatus Tisiphia endosymbiont of Neophilaenus lineatus]|uniref:palindromic element RPE1 domain-containing protein n=1 Tax=Candidatus Tisiphia endosymbiont of Neophilaenus lineatus TaxID=3139336 RepID=UPI0035C99760
MTRLLNNYNRPLSKLACAEGFEGDAERRTAAAYSNVREDSSTASTYKSPAEVEFRKKSNKKSYIIGRYIQDIANHEFIQEQKFVVEI